MASGQKFTLTFDAQLNVGQMKSAINGIQGELNRLQLPSNLTKGISSTLSSLEKEIRNFEIASGKDLGNKSNFSALERSAARIDSLFRDLEIQARDLGNSVDLSKFFPETVAQTIEKANNALKEYSANLKKLQQKEARAEQNLANAQNRRTVAQNNLTEKRKELDDFQQQYEQVLNQIYAKVRMTPEDIFDTKSIEQAMQKVEELFTKYKNIQEGTNSKGKPYAERTKNSYAKQQAELEGLIETYKQLSTVIPTAEKAVKSLETTYTNATNKVKEMELALEQAKNGTKAGEAEGIKKVFETLNAEGIDTSGFQQNIKGAEEALRAYAQAARGDAATALETLLKTVRENGGAFSDFGANMRTASSDFQAFNDSVRDVSALKSRIQYFFGLSNAVNLAKRAVRQAVNTIKDLDKVMTETAVVTDFSVSDMWEQLPEYTKRANELGVTTKSAYEAATLYYQQGLDTTEVSALSVETLKMARIAGLDAAEATDRMTNALRGFNMELSAASAQRVDDVYSELAANTASNVDEISTAMTKVASLAHSANMEFETTAAFLAQIIETTRESAETAGTALKTVVARFSEVKKLYDTNQLKGTDEEGQIIDVNKIGTALRTAGIDLNKYFLGEVGLDDIFMELASKWDDLTSLQQRYIATQAAGSRQQSRFIALMQDYARTQELVGKAYNSEGASARQFEKTQESLESKLNRLSNAWNEFLMGLSNSVIVKGIVDALTTLLNIINKVTSAFGDGIGFILKWGVALSSIAGGKALFKSGGALDVLLGSILNDTGIGNALFQNKVLSGKLLGGGAAKGSQYAAELAAGTTQIGTSSGILARLFPNLVKSKETKAAGETVGKNIADSVVESVSEELDDVDIAEEIFESQWGESAVEATNKVTNATNDLSEAIGDTGDAAAQVSKTTVTNLTSILSVLGALAVVAAAVAAAYQIWLEYTPEGQLKQAEQLADAMNAVATTAQKTADDFKRAKESYADFNKEISEAKNTKEIEKATRKRTEYVAQLLEQHSELAQYVESYQQGGELVLTIDESQLDAAIKRASQAAIDIAVNADFANAIRAGRQAAVYRSQITAAGVDLSTRKMTSAYGNVASVDQGNTQLYTEKMGNQDIAKYLRLQQQADAATAEMRVYVAKAYGELLSDKGLEDSVANSLVDVVASAFNDEKYQKEINKKRRANWWAGEGSEQVLRNKYLALYGVEADASLDRKQLARAVAVQETNASMSDNLEQVANLLSGTRGSQFQTLLEGWNGTGNMATIALGQYTNEQIQNLSDRDLLKLIGLDTQDLEQADLTGLFVDLANALDISTDAIKDHIKAQIKENKEIQKRNKATIYESILGAGLSVDENLQKKINGMAPEQAAQIAKTLDSAKDLLSPDLYQNLVSDILSDSLTVSLEDLNNLFSSIDLNDPISAFNDLAKARKDAEAVGDKGIIKYIDQIEKSNEALFTSSNLVQSFITSSDYDSLTDSLQKFIETNGEVTSKNIKELAESNGKLKELLDSNTVSAQALARALTLVENGTIGFDALTDAMLKALGAGVSFKELIDEVTTWIEDFNEGTDLKEGTEHIGDLGEKFKEYISNWEFGNEPVENIYDHFFGEGAYNEYMEKNWDTKPFEEIEAELTSQMDALTSLAENEGLGALQGLSGQLRGLSGEGTEFTWDLSKFKNTEEAIAAVQQGLADLTNTTDVSRETALAFIESWGSHMWDLKRDWDQLTYDTQLAAFANELGGELVITEQQLAAFGELTHKTVDEVLADLELLYKNNGKELEIPILVNWKNKDGSALTGEELIQKFSEAAGIDSTTRYNGSFLETVYDYESFLSGFQQGLDGLNFNALHDHLVDTFKLSSSQADEVINRMASRTGKVLTEDVMVPVYNEANGIIEMIPQTIQATTAEGLRAASDAAREAANTALVAQQLADLPIETVGARLGASIEEGAQAGIAAVANAINSLPSEHKVDIIYNEIGRPSLSYHTKIGGDARGGIVSSYAKGSENFKVKPGTALTGEEGPELVWNKNSGYAYLTGSRGAEFQDLQPGDRIFNAEETRKILRNSTEGQKKYFGSFAKGGWKKTKDKNTGIGADAGKSGKEKDEEWKNEIDWLYNLVEDIAELERIQTQFQEDYDDYLTDQNKTGRDLYNLLVKQLGNLQAQLNHQTFALEKREQEMREFMDTTNTYDDYLWYNWDDRTIEIDWDQIEAIKASDKETYDKIADLISEAEDIQGKMDDAEDAIQDIENQIQELENIWRDTFTDFEERVYDAIVKQYQTVIDSYSELNTTLNDTNSSILDSLQKQISLERQIRDNTKTEEDIGKNEAQLAYLQRDTTGGNLLASLELQKELDEQRQDYEDNLIDQAIERLQEDNDTAAKQREHQIEIMQAQLDYQSENGEFNDAVQDLLTSAMGADGELLTNSDLVNLLKDQENWAAMSDVSKQVWDEELNSTFKEVAAFLLKETADEIGQFMIEVNKAVTDIYAVIGSKSQAATKNSGSSSSGGSGGGGGSNGGSGSGSKGTTKYKIVGTNARGGPFDTKSAAQNYINQQVALAQGSYEQAKARGATQAEIMSAYATWQQRKTWSVQSYKAYKSGGLSTFTGPAWLDGTPSEPEYVLNARQTEAFLKLADVLPSIMNSSNGATTLTTSNITLNLSMNVDQISSDYDVDRIAGRVKDIIYNAGSYRNVNVLNFSR